LEQADGNEGRWLVELAAVACSDIGCHVGSHAWPPNMSSKDVQGCVFALMSRERRIVSVVKEAVAKVLVVGNA
jgi:hypothetical protein